MTSRSTHGSKAKPWKTIGYALGALLLSALVARPPERLIYVSCGFAAFQRELTTLTGAGLRLAELRAYDLFPFTEHLEVAARFER